MNEEAKLLEDTGERMMPESSDSDIFWEHIYRYRFATRFVRGKRVLDVACGEGYGSASLLAAGASSVVGVDISREACEHARHKYGVDAREGNADKLPFGDKSFDVVVSFETIEHLGNPNAFVEECWRVLADGGTLVMSTPNTAVSDVETRANPFHHSYLDASQFLGLLAPRFSILTLYSQLINSAAWWEPDSLCAIRSPWLKVRGFWRVRSIIASHLTEEAIHMARRDPVACIMATDSYLSRLFNPYTVRKTRRWSRERATYLVALARK